MSFHKTYEEARAAHKPMKRGQITRATGKMRSTHRRARRTADGDRGRDIKLEMDQLVRDILALRDDRCFTCPETEGLQVGHLFRRGLETTRWSLTNNHLQCPMCNQRHEYEPDHYIENFLQRYGEEAYMALRAISRKSHKLSYTELLDLRDGLRSELARLRRMAA